MSRVLVTRAAEDAPLLSHLLSRAGLDPVEVPLLLRRWRVEQLAASVAEDPHYDVLLLTSATAAEVFAAACPRWPRQLIVAVVGPATGRRAVELGLPVSVMPERATAERLIEALPPLAGKTVLYPRADMASPATAEALRVMGATVHAPIAYTNVAPPDYVDALRAALPVDATTLMSGSSARRLAEADLPLAQLGAIVAVGPSTQRVAVAVGLPVAAVARTHTVAGIVSAVQRALSAG